METVNDTETIETDSKINLLNSINNGYKPELELNLETDHLKNVIESDIPIKEALDKLYKVKEDKIRVKELIIESEIDFIKSVKQLQKVYKEELDNMVRQLNDLYNSELLNIKQIFRKAVIGEPLIEMVNEVSKHGWVLVMKDSSVSLYKCYNPIYHVTLGVYESGEEHEYEEPVTSLRGIYVNILHPKITSGTIHLSTERGQHPNCDSEGFGAACAGTLDDREIPISDTGALIALLQEISNTYEVFHGDSAYYIPTKAFEKIEKGNKTWTT